VRGSEAVSRLDLRYPWLVRTVRTGTDHFDNGGLAAGEGAIWVAHGGLILRPDTLLTRIDPATGKVTGRLAAGAAGGLAVGAGSVWLAQAAYALTRVDAKTLSVVTTVTLGTTAAPVAVSVGEGAVWVASRVGVPCPPGLAMPGAPPATQCQSTKFGTVSRIDPATNSVTATIRVPGVPDAIVAAGGGVWVTSESTRTILRIDPKTTRIVARIRPGSQPGGLAAADDGTIWVAAS
jgi:DNA-binding beta-propeller fold protein YncE